MNIRQLRYFLAVAQELNFTRAAERVGIAQPPLSQQIIALEQELRTPLFTRENRRVELTPAGEILVDHAHRVLNAAAAAVDAVHMAESGTRAKLAVGAIYSSLYAFLPDVLRAFAVSEPSVELSLQEMTISQQISALSEGVIEVGLLRGPIHHRDLRTEVLFRERLVLAVPTQSEWTSDDPASLTEIAEMPMVMVQRQTHRSYSDRVYELFDNSELQPRISHYTQDMHTAICLVAAGLGVSVVPAVVQLLQTSGVRYRPLDGSNAGVTFALAMRRTGQSKLLDRFAEASREKATQMLTDHPSLFVIQDGA
jgi:DNA-binding transcriptional LysR family regulator